jgi:hypothetical protein
MSAARTALPIQSSVASILKSRLNIVDVVREYVRLKKIGPDKYLGLCPFHTETTASFNVDESKQVAHCFGCEWGGDLISFAMQAEELTFPGTLRFLNSRYGIDVADYEIPESERFSGFDLRQGEQFGMALAWRLERYLESAKLRFWSEGEPEVLATLISTLTQHLQDVQSWNRRTCFRVLRSLKEGPACGIAFDCLEEAREFSDRLDSARARVKEGIEDAAA